jgi:hypothetical protein
MPETTMHQGVKHTATGQKNPPQLASPVPVVAELAPPPPSEQEIAAHRVIQQAEVARQEAMRELGAFRFLGFLKQNGVAQAFLARGNELYVVTNGEAMDGRYVITVLDTSSVRIRSASTGVETIIGKSERELLP